MNYTQVGIANVALGRIGARGQIVDINENSPNAIKVLACWDSVFQEVLSERDWRFAKTRTQIRKVANVTPLYGYNFAYELPSDLLRFVRPHKRPVDRARYAWVWGPEGVGFYPYSDPPFFPPGWAYIIEAVNTATSGDPTYQQCLLTNYDGSEVTPAINYIRLITDYTQLTPGFVNCLTWRLAKELAINVTEDKQKFELAEDQYRQSLNSAEAQNECLDLVSFDEAGSTSWEAAGRCVRW